MQRENLLSAQPQRQLSLLDATSIMVGIIVGIGIYQTAPLVAACVPNSASLFSLWIMGGLLSLAGALCNAELASLYPENGGDYVYLREAYGPKLAFLFGWGSLVVIRPGSIAAMAFPFAHYLENIWAPLKATSWEDSQLLLFAVSAVLLITAINCLKLTAGVWTQNALTILKVLGLCLLFAAALFSPSAASSTLQTPRGDSTNFGLGLILVLFTYGGWQEVSYVAAEVKDSEKNILRSILLSITIVTLLFVLTNAAFVQSLGFLGLAQSTTVAADALAGLFPHAASALMSLLVCISALGAMSGLIFTGARISHVLGRDFSAFRILGYWDAGRGTPLRALLVQGFLSILIIVFSGSFSETIVYTTAIVWLFFLLTGAAVLILRYRDRNSLKRLRFPLVVPCALIFCLSAVYLAYSAVLYDWIGSLISFVVVGSGALLVGWKGSAEKLT